MITATFALLLAAAGSAFAGTATPPAAAAASSPAVAAVVSTQTVSTIYTGDRVRDPFLPAAMGGGARRRDDAKTGEPEVVDIHAMTLRGIMKDSRVDYALFTSETGASYLLRGGRLYDERRKAVPGIRGAIKIKQKTVELITTDKDVQVFRLGEDEKDKETP